MLQLVLSMILAKTLNAYEIKKGMMRPAEGISMSEGSCGRRSTHLRNAAELRSERNE